MIADFLPKGYLSWSQIDSANRDAENYYRQYFLQEQSQMPDWVPIGNLFHAIGDHKDWGPDEVTAAGFGQYIPAFQALAEHAQRPNPETEFLIDYNSAYGITPIKGFMDGVDPEKHIVYEIKTSPFRLWDQAKLDNHGQTKLYSLVYHSNAKVMPEVRLKSIVLVPDPRKCKVRNLKKTYTFQEALSVQNEINNAISIIYQLNERHRKSTSV